MNTLHNVNKMFRKTIFRLAKPAFFGQWYTNKRMTVLYNSCEIRNAYATDLKTKSSWTCSENEKSCDNNRWINSRMEWWLKIEVQTVKRMAMMMIIIIS